MLEWFLANADKQTNKLRQDFQEYFNTWWQNYDQVKEGQWGQYIGVGIDDNDIEICWKQWLQWPQWL